MSQENFIGGFLLGTLVGGVVGGVLGVLVASKMSQTEESATDESFAKRTDKPKRHKVKGGSTEQNIETARRGLEDKIAQLNDAIDDVRQQLGSVNGTTKSDDTERAIASDS